SSRPARVRDMVDLVLKNRGVAVLLLFVVIVTMTYDPIQTLAPALVQKVFQAPASWVGWFLGALGAGAVMGTLLPLGRPTIKKVPGYLGVFGAGMVLYALAPSPEVALIGPLFGGAGYLLANTGSQILLLEAAGEERAGQAMALYSM